jgi:outer membrane receptor protein involved in Fe transport
MPLYNTSPGNNVLAGAPAGSGTNVAFLPLAAFDTADVVRGPGANAPSVVDSIGGSFVLHAPGRVDHNQFEFSTSTDPYGGIVSNMQAAVRFGKLSATVAYAVNDSPGPLSGNYVTGTYFGLLTVNGHSVVNTGSTGFAPVANFPGCAYSNCVAQDNFLFCCQSMSTAWTQHSGALSLSYDISPSVSAQVFYAGSSVESANYNNVVTPVDFTPDAGYAGSLAPGTYDYPNLQNEGPIASADSLLEEKVTAYFGRGVLRLAAVQNNSSYSVNFANEVAPNGQYTVFGTAYYASSPATPVNFNGVPAQLTFHTFANAQNYWVNNRDLLGSYAMQVGTSSNIGVSFVSSYYNAPGTEQALCPGPAYYNLLVRPDTVSERTNEFRFNASTQLSDRLSLDASWYFTQGSYHVPNPNSSFSEFSPATSWANLTFPYSAPRFSAVWRANSNVAIRAAAGGGFALPPITQLVGENGTPYCVGGYCYVSITNLNLKPEESFGFDVGTDVRFHRDTVLSFDLYNTNLYGQFFASSNVQGTCPTCGGLPLIVTENQNLSQSRFQGIIFDLRHDPVRGMYWHAALGLTRGYVVNVPAGFYNNPAQACTNCANTYVVPGINFDGADQGTVPYANGTGLIGYRWSPEKYVDLAPSYYGNNNTYFQRAFVEIDAHAAYPLTKNISLLAAFRNITGIYDQAYQTYSPTSEVPLEGSAAPSTAPSPILFGIPYGPRTIVVTAKVSL